MRWWLLLGLIACAPQRPEGSCVFWIDCGEGGACEYTAGVEGDDIRFDCSFADDTCPTGRRFGEFASAARADQCVDFAPEFGGLCDDAHPCSAGVACQLDRCNNVAELDATAEAFAARCSSNLRAGGDTYLWGYVLGIFDTPIAVGVFLDADPLTAASAAATPPPPIINSTQISIGANHLCSVGTIADGTPYSACIGRENDSAVGNDPDAATAFGADNPLGLHVAISAGTVHSCAIRDTTIVDCWGSNADRQLDGTDNNPPYLEATVTLPHRTGAIATGKDFTCAATSRGVYCWGGHWKMGTFEFPDGRVLPVQGIPANPVTAIAAGEAHACAIVDDLLWCWGANDTGQVTGEPSIGPQLPFQPLGATSVLSVSAGRLHTCAVTADHEVMCWGDNGVGQLGSATTSHAPQVVALEARATGPIALSDDATCVVLEDSLVHCWGSPELTSEYNPPLDRFAICLQ